MKHKWTPFTFSRGDFKTVEAYLNEQAEQGWELDRVGILAQWKRTERRDLTYCVDLAKPRQPRDEQADYVEFCTEGGWELTALTGQMYIFKSLPGTNPIPIQTDPELERANYNKYYIRNVLLSVLFLALYIGFWVFVNAAMGRYEQSELPGLSLELMSRWVIAGIVPALPIWAVWAVWKLVDLIRVMIAGRAGRSPRWVMWVNCVLSFLAGVGGVLLLLGSALEVLFIADMNVYLPVLAILWGIACFYRALTIEKEMFKRERRRYIVSGVTLIVLFALLIAGRAVMPYGRWDTNPYSTDEDAMEQYVRLENQPFVRGEDIGLPLDEEKTEYFYLTYELTPQGKHWKLENYYQSSGLDATGCETYTAPTVWMAGRLVDMEVEKATQSAYLSTYSHDVGVEMEEVEVDWADEAWYGERHFVDEMVSVLVVRTGKQVTYLSAPISLMTEELLSNIENRLCD